MKHRSDVSRVNRYCRPALYTTGRVKSFSKCDVRKKSEKLQRRTGGRMHNGRYAQAYLETRRGVQPLRRVPVFRMHAHAVGEVRD